MWRTVVLFIACVFLTICTSCLDLPKKSGREEKRSMLNLEESVRCRKNVVSSQPSISEKR